ncbi:MAG: replication initiator protein [Arizlama microvirus]|nr:MAG: replication initiator protein [Arizlama microvirus]
MPCYSPLQAIQDEGGRVQIVGRGNALASFSLRCGRCIGCRLLYSQMWAIRCVHESKGWERNCVVTLTYRDADLPSDSNLVYRDFQLFMKRVRKHFAPDTVRFFCGGEYGEKNGRPHFHAVLFNCDFDDKVVYKEREGRPVLWTSSRADKLWRLGDVVVGECTFDSAAYIARYVVKKVYGDLAALHYVDPDTGVLLCPEFAHMSLKPGIGFNWLSKFRSDVLVDLKITERGGHKVSLPRLYMKYLEKWADIEPLKLKQKLELGKLWRDNTPQRLRDKARVASARLGLANRVL